MEQAEWKQAAARYASETGAGLAAEGWTVRRLTPPSRLHGANGIRAGSDGRIYVAQVAGSQVSAVDPDSGVIETISPLGGEIVAPDDLAFDEAGNLYLTEITENRVSMLARNGFTRVIRGDMPVANPITYHQGRLIAGECRMGARILELDRDGGAPRVIADNVPMANAFEVGPDGKLYFPVMAANEIWRVDLAGGAPEVVARGLGVPDSVKFDMHGYIVSTQVSTGEVLRIDPRTGDLTVLARLKPGLDNVAFIGERTFISGATGFIVELLADGGVRELVRDGFVWPMGLAVGTGDALYICDGGFSYLLRPGGEPEVAGNFHSENYPGYARGVAWAGPGEYVLATGTGEVARFWPAERRSERLAEGLRELYGVAISPSGAIVVAELGTGRVLELGGGAIEILASGLDRPKGVTFDAEGRLYVAEAGAGRVVKLTGGRTETVLDGLGKPEGIAERDGRLFVVDAGTKELVVLELATGRRDTIASHLPIGDPAGVTPKHLGPIGTFSGPMGLFAAVAVGSDGALFVSADAEGSVLRIEQV